MASHQRKAWSSNKISSSDWPTSSTNSANLQFQNSPCFSLDELVVSAASCQKRKKNRRRREVILCSHLRDDALPLLNFHYAQHSALNAALKSKYEEISKCFIYSHSLIYVLNIFRHWCRGGEHGRQFTGGIIIVVWKEHYSDFYPSALTMLNIHSGERTTTEKTR